MAVQGEGQTREVDRHDIFHSCNVSVVGMGCHEL